MRSLAIGRWPRAPRGKHYGLLASQTLNKCIPSIVHVIFCIFQRVTFTPFTVFELLLLRINASYAY